MEQLQGVFTSDSINLYGYSISAGALASVLWENGEIGNPLDISHDFLRIIGWNFPVALHFEPGLTRLSGISLIPKTSEESKQINQFFESFQVNILNDSKQKIEELHDLINPHFNGKEIPLCKGCIAFIESGLASRVFPEIFIKMDKDGLIPLEQLNPKGPGVFQIGNLTLFAHSFFRRSISRMNSLNYPFLDQIQNLVKDDISIKIALDTDMVGLASTYGENIELEYWWGPKFDDNLAAIQPGVTHHEASNREKLFHGISGTQFWWQSRKNEHILEVEELLGISDELTEYGCRYVHSIVPETTGEINHFDGAIRAYSKNELANRLKEDIAHAGRHTRYTKLWRIDGFIDTSIWKNLLSDYFRDNHLVGEYLGAIEEKVYTNNTGTDQEAKTDSLSEEYIPYSLTPGMGIRIALSFHPRVDKNNVERKIVSLDTFSFKDEHFDIVESNTIELMKALKRLDSSLSIPEDVKFVNFKDFYENFPLILHSETTLPESLYVTLEAIKMLVFAWNKKGHDKVVSYSIGFPIQDKEVRISVLGHISDLEEWLSNPLSNPPVSQDKICEWADKVSGFIKKRYPEANDKPPLFKTLMTSGILLIKRKRIDDSKFNIYFSEEDQALIWEYSGSEKAEPLMKALEMREFIPAPAFIIFESECTKCGQSYMICDCSKILDDGVVQKISNMRIACFFYTDRPVY